MEKINKTNYIKIKNFQFSKETLKKVLHVRTQKVFITQPPKCLCLEHTNNSHKLREWKKMKQYPPNEQNRKKHFTQEDTRKKRCSNSLAIIDLKTKTQWDTLSHVLGPRIIKYMTWLRVCEDEKQQNLKHCSWRVH